MTFFFFRFLEAAMSDLAEMRIALLLLAEFGQRKTN